MKYLNEFRIFLNESVDDNMKILLGDNKIYYLKNGDELKFMEHYKNFLIRKYGSSFGEEINLDKPVTFIKVEESDLIRPNLIVRTEDDEDWIFAPEAFILYK